MSGENARLFTNPITGFVGRAVEHAEIAGISTATFYQRRRKWGDNDPRCYASELDSHSCNPTQEYLDLDDTEKSMVPLREEIGTWEAENYKPLEDDVQEPPVRRGRPKEEVKVSPGEKPIYEAILEYDKGIRTIDIAKKLGLKPKYVSMKAYQLADKGFLRNVGKGTYAPA